MWVPINSSPAFCYHQLSGTPLPHSLPGDISSTILAIRSICNKCLSVGHQSISITHHHPEQASILLNNWGPPGGHGLALNHSSWSQSATCLLKNTSPKETSKHLGGRSYWWPQFIRKQEHQDAFSPEMGGLLSGMFGMGLIRAEAKPWCLYSGSRKSFTAARDVPAPCLGLPSCK